MFNNIKEKREEIKSFLLVNKIMNKNNMELYQTFEHLYTNWQIIDAYIDHLEKQIANYKYKSIGEIK